MDKISKELWAYRMDNNLCGECGLADERTVGGNGRCQNCSDKAVQDYIQMREKHGYSAEELCEMRAAFGPGAEVVNVLTGQKIRL